MASSLKLVFLIIISEIWVLANADRTSNEVSGKINSNSEQQLIKDLVYTRRIDRYSRPVQKYTDSVTVEMELWVYNILGLDHQTETFSINAILKSKWMDLNLTWTPSNYSAIETIYIPDFLIWKPDIVHINSVNLKESTSSRMWSYVRVWYNGSVELKSPSVYNTHCTMDVRKFPFDEHECKFVFSSWTFFSTQLNISAAKTFHTQGEKLLKLHQYSNSEWEIVDWTSKVIYDVIGGEPCAEVEYTFRIRRLTSYYKFAVLIPTIMLILVSLAIFWFPPTAGEKITFGGFMTLILTLLLVHLYWVVPRSASTVPGIVLLCGMTVAYVGLSLLISVLTINLSRGRHYVAPPSFICWLLTSDWCIMLCLKVDKAQLEHRSLNNSEGNSEEPFNRDWIIVATAIDRICFYLYIISFIILFLVSFI